MDASVASVFGDIEKRWAKLQANMAKDQVRSARLAEREAQRMGRGLGKGVEEGARRGKRALSDLERGFQQISRVAERETIRMARAQQRAAESFARRTSYRATRFLLPNAPLGSMARRAAGDILRGVGVRANLSENVRAVVSADKAARGLSSAGYIAGAQGPAGVRVDPNVLKAEARELAKRYGGSTEEILGGQRAFVAQRGNLAGARAISGELVKRSTATGANAEDVFRTAAKIDSALASQSAFQEEGVRNKAILRLIDTFAKQGKIGSVEFEEAAKQVPKLSGIAAGFTGDATKNLTQLMTVTQLAERGPAKNAATASTYAQNFALDISKRSGQFKDVAGVDVFKDGKIANLEDIIVGTLAATEQTKTVKRRGQKPAEMNQIQQLQAILPNKRSFLALQEFLNVFKGAGGGKAGIAAVREEFKRFGEAQGEQQINSDLATALDSTSNKAERLNARLEELTDNTLSRLLPVLEDMQPAFLSLVEKLGDVTTWIVENPKKAIGAAITAAIARAGLESALRSGIEQLILGGPLAGGPSDRGQKVARGAAALGSAAVIASLAVTTLTVGTMIIDELFNKDQEKQKQQLKDDLERFNLGQKLPGIAERSPAEAAGKVRESIAANEAEQEKIKDEQGSLSRYFMDEETRTQANLNKLFGTDFFGGDTEALKTRDESEKNRLAELKAENDRLVQVLESIEARLSGGIVVTNMPQSMPEGTESAL